MLSLLDLAQLSQSASAFKKPAKSPGPPLTPQLPPVPASAADWAQSALNFTPDPIQREMLDCTNPAVLLLCSRQSGKTQIAAIKAGHHALTRPGACVVVGARSARQSEILARRAAARLRRAGVPLKPAGLRTFGYQLPNESRIFALPHNPETTRGFDAVSLLIIDEAAYVSDDLYHMATAFQAAAVDPQIWLLSTAANQYGFFYEEWSDPRRTSWRRFKVTGPECPRIRPEFLELERIRKGESIFRREYLCEFSSDGDQVITRDLIDNANQPGFQPWNNGRPILHP